MWHLTIQWIFDCMSVIISTKILSLKKTCVKLSLFKIYIYYKFLSIFYSSKHLKMEELLWFYIVNSLRGAYATKDSLCYKSTQFRNWVIFHKIARTLNRESQIFIILSCSLRMSKILKQDCKIRKMGFSQFYADINSSRLNRNLQYTLQRSVKVFRKVGSSKLHVILVLASPNLLEWCM